MPMAPPEEPPVDVAAFDESTLSHLRITSTADPEKLLQMDKVDIIKYYEEVIDEALNEFHSALW